MKMVLAMLAIFLLTGAFIDRITRWTVIGLALAILGVLLVTRFTF